MDKYSPMHFTQQSSVYVEDMRKSATAPWT